MADGNLIPVRPRFAESLRGKSYIVTGGGRGIGYAITRAIAESGGNVVVFDALPEPVNDFQNLEAEFGVKAKFMRTDVTDETAVKSNFDQGIRLMGGLDGCVTAAGICIEAPFVEYTPSQVRKILDVNVVGTFLVAQHATRHFLEHSIPGAMVFIASVSGHIVTPGRTISPYNVSKAGVRMLTTALGAELGPHGIRVNCISPGCIETDMTNAIADFDPQGLKLLHRMPWLGKPGSRNDISAAAVFLLSDAACYATGSELTIDGGLVGGPLNLPKLD